MLKKTLVAVVATAIAMGAAVSASAGEPGDVLDPNSLGAAVAVPYLTTPSNGGVRMTVGTLTNASSHMAISLHLIWISATDWSEINYDCPLTPLETTYFIYEQIPGTDNALVTFECSDNQLHFPNGAGTNNIVTRALNGADGIMFAAIECQLGDEGCYRREENGEILRTKRDDILSADMTVLDFGAGVAFSAPAIHIQGNITEKS